MKKMYLFLALYLVLLLYLYLPSGYVQDEGHLELYFCQEVNCSFLLTQLVEQSSDVKCAFYDLGEESVIESLRGKDVLIFEENYLEGFEPVGSAGLMHHKFCVFDSSIVLTGSWNPTYRGTYLNDNLVVLIYSDKIAKEYLHEWKNLGSTSPSKFNLSGTLIDLCFSPQGNCEDLIVEEINKSTSVKFLTFTFTSSRIADVVRHKNYSGVIEKSRRSKYTVDLDFIFDTNSYTMHHKAFILDNSVILGSYNPTKSANDKNNENLLIIHEDLLVEALNAEFERIYLKATSIEQ